MGGIVRFVGAEQIAGFVGSATSDTPQPQATGGKEQSRRQTLVRSARPAGGVREEFGGEGGADPEAALRRNDGLGALTDAETTERVGKRDRPPLCVNNDRQAREGAAAHPVPTGEQHAVEIAERRLGHRGPEQGELHSRSLADEDHSVDGHLRGVGSSIVGSGAPARAAPDGQLRRPASSAARAEPSVSSVPASGGLDTGTSSWAGMSPIEILRRLDTVIAATIIANATTAITARSGAEALSPRLNWTTAGATSTDTRFITLINGLIAGPAVSLNGSPTVSPITVASCAGLPLPPYEPSSTILFALSHAPPEFERNTAISTPAAIAPARYPASGATPNVKPISTGARIANRPGVASSRSESRVQISTTRL